MTKPKDGKLTTLHALLGGMMEGRIEAFVQPFLSPYVSFGSGRTFMNLAFVGNKMTYCCHEWIRPSRDSYKADFGKLLWDKSEKACGLPPIKLEVPDPKKDKKK